MEQKIEKDQTLKRRFSGVSLDEENTPTPARQTPWGSDAHPPQLGSTPSDRQRTLYSSNSLAPLLALADSTPPHSAATTTTIGSLVTETATQDALPEIDDRIFNW
jgi:hypothetical protein